MRIHKILNNNVLVTLDSVGNEKIITGRGIGFKKKIGDLVDQSLIEKQFSLTSQELLPKFTELLSEISLEVITVSEIIINYATTSLGQKLQDSIYISLTDHIHYAIERQKQGFFIPNGFLWETKKLYAKEFKIAEYALEIINERLGIKLPEDEAGFITFHIINAQLNDSMSNIITMTKIMREILHIVKYYFKFEYDEESLTYQRFIVHLKFFAHRMLNNNVTKCHDIALLEIIKHQYQQAFLCTQRVAKHLEQHYDHTLTEDETLYLTIHIERLRNELQQIAETG